MNITRCKSAVSPRKEARRRYTELFADGHMTKSAEVIVHRVTAHACAVIGARQGSVVWELVKSLTWPFVARHSGTEWTLKELNRFMNSMRCTASNISEVVSSDNKEQTYCKYWLDGFLCRAFRDNQFPIRDSWIVKPLFVGWCKNFINRLLVRSRIDVSFIYSLQKGSKRAWPALGKEKEASALKKHAERLGQYHGAVPEDLSAVIDMTAREVFKGISDMVPTKFMPSGSSCNQASRKQGGPLSLVGRYNLNVDAPDAKVMGKLPHLASTINAWRQAEFDKLEERMSQSSPYSLLEVHVIALPEPGKFRIITLGDGYLYTALQPLQGLMLSCWKKHRASSMLRDDLTERVNEIAVSCAEFPLWCSVDYEAATDLLKREATFAAFNGMIEEVDGQIIKPPLFDLGLFSLCNGVAVYPDKTRVPLVEGQLMGHPMSFQLLCVINLAVYRCAIRRWVADDVEGREAKGRRMWSNVLVNGDDMLFKCDKDFYPVFIQCAADAGFKVSQGKQYLSPDCCMINSQVFQGKSTLMKRLGYLNMKLLTGLSLKQGESEATPTQIGKDLSKMVDLCPWTACTIPTAFRRWEKDNGKWFGKRYKPNWYLPVHLGGFGVARRHAPTSWRVTKQQRLIAARFVNDPRMALYRKEGMDIPTAKMAGALASWRMVPGDYVRAEHETDDLNDEWLARLCYAARAHHGSKPVSDAVMISKFAPEFRLKPMSMEAIERYWDAQVFASKLPTCPSISEIRTKQSDGSPFIKPKLVRMRAEQSAEQERMLALWR